MMQKLFKSAIFFEIKDRLATYRNDVGKISNPFRIRPKPDARL